LEVIFNLTLNFLLHFQRKKLSTGLRQQQQKKSFYYPYKNVNLQKLCFSEKKYIFTYFCFFFGPQANNSYINITSNKQSTNSIPKELFPNLIIFKRI